MDGLAWGSVGRSREGIIDDVIMHENMTSFVQKTCEKDVVGIVTFVPDRFTSHQSQYYLYYNGIPGFLRKCSLLNVK